MKRLVSIVAVCTAVLTLPAMAATFKNQSTFETTGIAVRVGTNPVPEDPNAVIRKGQQRTIDTGTMSVEIYAGSVNPSARWRPSLVGKFASLKATDVITCSEVGGKLTCTR